LFISGALTGMAVLYFVALWLLAVPLDQWLYGGKYSDYVHLIAPLGLVPIFIALTTGLSLILRSIQKVQFYLIGGIISGIVGIVSGFIMIKVWGITGSAISMMLTYLVSFISTFVLYKMWFPYEQLVKKTKSLTE
jgi:O-antigen/teichoic acid export membrane protein